MNKQVYKHFNQVKEAIQGVEAIDYFFAKEMLTALATEKVVEQSLHKNYQESHQENLYHVFLALSASLRAGHSCFVHSLDVKHRCTEIVGGWGNILS